MAQLSQEWNTLENYLARVYYAFQKFDLQPENYGFYSYGILNDIIRLMSEQKEDPSQAEDITPENILKSATSRFNRLEEKADQAMVKNPELRHQKLVERAEMMASLPDKISEILEKRESFPKQELDRLEEFAHLANERLEMGSDIALSTLLIPRGTKVGEPNLLEKMVNRLYPSSDGD